MTSLDSEKRSNGYTTRRFWTGCYSQSSSAFKACTPTSGVSGGVVWSPKIKKYFCADLDGTGATIYARTPNGLWSLVHTGSGNGVGLFWSRRLGMLVHFTSTHIYTSTDGTTWVSRTVPASYVPDSLNCFCDANTYSVFFAQESGIYYMYTTASGVSWDRNSIGSTAIQRCGVINGSDTVLFAQEHSSAGYLRYTTNGTSVSNVIASEAMYAYFPPTPLRQEHWYLNATASFRSTDGVNFSGAGANIRTGNFTTSYSFVFGGAMYSQITTSTPNAFDFLNFGTTSDAFSNVLKSDGVYTGMGSYSMATVQGEFIAQSATSSGYIPRPVGTWLEPGDYEIWGIGGGGQNVSTTVGGCAGAMFIHNMTVTESYRYIVYNIAGVVAVVDVGGSDGLQYDQFLAYASFPAYSGATNINQACFGTKVFYGMPAIGSAGAACGPSGGGSAYRGIGSNSGCGTTMTTTATTPPDWWQPDDWVGNPSGTGYPGTSGDSSATIGLLGASTGSGVFGSYGSGGCNTSTGYAQLGGEALAIIYGR